jgi:hypothetical protein
MGTYLFIANPLTLGPSNPVFFVVAMSLQLLAVMEERLFCGESRQSLLQDARILLRLDE